MSLHLEPRTYLVMNDSCSTELYYSYSSVICAVLEESDLLEVFALLFFRKVRHFLDSKFFFCSLILSQENVAKATCCVSSKKYTLRTFS